MHRAVRLLIAVALVCVCAVAPALAASGPKRGYYIDPKLQTYIITTKDITAHQELPDRTARTPRAARRAAR